MSRVTYRQMRTLGASRTESALAAFVPERVRMTAHVALGRPAMYRMHTEGISILSGENIRVSDCRIVGAAPPEPSDD
jgi:hypothetical protein